MLEVVYFTIVAVALYVLADALLDWIERLRGARFKRRELVFLAIILPLALVTFWLVRLLGSSTH